MELKIKGLSKTFGNLNVLNQVNVTLPSGPIHCLMGPSGSGKTTFLRILMGLEEADSGTIEGLRGKKVSAVFQEDRLCEAFCPVDNVAMVLPGSASRNKKQAYEELLCLLPEESLSRPVSTLSGGMKRRVAIVRALSAPSDMLLMDEPFSGLDEATKGLVIRHMLNRSAGKLVIVSTHQEEDVDRLNGIMVRL